MLSKCANPDCLEVFRHLHQGKIFFLSPTPEVERATGGEHPALYERFWLCDKCSKQMKVVWGGTQVKLERLPPQTMQNGTAAHGPTSGHEISKGRMRGRAASAGRDDE
jgi:hypothetical protein